LLYAKKGWRQPFLLGSLNLLAGGGIILHLLPILCNAGSTYVDLESIEANS